MCSLTICSPQYIQLMGRLLTVRPHLLHDPVYYANQISPKRHVKIRCLLLPNKEKATEIQGNQATGISSME